MSVLTIHAKRGNALIILETMIVIAKKDSRERIATLKLQDHKAELMNNQLISTFNQKIKSALTTSAARNQATTSAMRNATHITATMMEVIADKDSTHGNFAMLQPKVVEAVGKFLGTVPVIWNATQRNVCLMDMIARTTNSCPVTSSMMPTVQIIMEMVSVTRAATMRPVDGMDLTVSTRRKSTKSFQEAFMLSWL
jgi:hypothetical protein